MSKHGRNICMDCAGEFPYNRENLKRRKMFGGKFLCKRCEKKRRPKQKESRTIQT